MRFEPSQRLYDETSGEKSALDVPRTQPAHQTSPTTAAVAILGGVSIYGGTGKALGIEAELLTLAVLRAGLNALGTPPYIHDIATGAILLAVAPVAVPGFTPYLGTSLRSRRWWGTKRRRAL